jgi:hypothetical protein
VLPVDLRLIVLVLVILHRIVIRARLRLVPTTDEEVIEDLKKLLNLILALEERLFPCDLSARLPKLCALIKQCFVHVGIRRGPLGALLSHRSLTITPHNLLLSLLEDCVSLDDIKNLLSAVSASCLLDHLGQVR